MGGEISKKTFFSLPHSRPKITIYTALIFFATFVFLFWFIFYSKTARTLTTMVYFYKSALSSENSKVIKNNKTPNFKNISYPDGPETTAAWLFLPKESKSKSALIISPGVGLNQNNKILIMQIADSLRNSGITVMVPYPKDNVNDLITVASVESYKNAFLYLENLNGVNPNKIGLMGFCVGSDMLLLASAKPEIANKVLFVLSLAAYSDINDYLAQILSGKTIGPNSHYWMPKKLVQDIAAKNIFDRLDSQNDKEILEKILADRNLEKDLKTSLSPQGVKVLGILNSKDPTYIKNELPKLNPKIKDLQNLSPVNFTNKIKAPVYMLHDKADTFEPVEESERLKSALGSKADFLETAFMNHTVLRDDLTLNTWLSEGPKILGFFYKIFYKTS